MADDGKTGTTDTTGPGNAIAARQLQKFQRDVRGAVELLDFAIETGRNISDGIIQRITTAENYLNSSQWPADDQRTEFEKAFRDLAIFMKPVTIDTLRATTEYPDESESVWARLFNRVTFRTTSAAKRYSKKFWVLIIICLAVIITGEALKNAFAYPNPKTDEAVKAVDAKRASAPTLAAIEPVFVPLLPFVYGWLGALVYLLRAAHDNLAERTFDSNRVPEYYNRMLLGFISGGVVLMFGEFSGKEAAASFIVGYNTDYLFQALERTANAIFPKDKGAEVAKPGIGSVAIDAASKVVAPGDSGSGSVTLNVPAPAGGVAVTFATGNALNVPPSLTVSEGKASAQFTFTVAASANEGTELITATAPDGSSASGSVQIKKPAALGAAVGGNNAG